MFIPGFQIPMGALGEVSISEEAETTAWVNAVVGDGGTVSSGRRTLVNNLIVSLKADGIWSKLDRLWLFAAENSQSALRDIVAAAAATATGSPTFTADQGYTGATSKYITTNFDATSGSPNFVQNSNSQGAWSLKSGQDSGVFYCYGGLTITYPRWVDDLTYWKPFNTGGYESAASTDGSGFWLNTRTASNAAAIYRNGSSFDTASGASQSVSSGPSIFLANHTGGEQWTGQIACGMFGGGLNSTEVGNLYTRLQTYMTAVGL